MDKWYKSDRETQIFYGITHIQNLKTKQTSEYNKKKHTYRYREQTIGYQWGEGKGTRQHGD